jgi:DNA helicase TIP49 (TBP-interacting protein)
MSTRIKRDGRTMGEKAKDLKKAKNIEVPKGKIKKVVPL